MQNQTDLLAHNLLLSYLNLLKRKNEVIIKSDSGKLQQIDTLAEANLHSSINISNEAETRREDIEQICEDITDNNSRLQAQSDSLAQTGLENTISISNEAEVRRKAESELNTKIEAITNEYADTKEKVDAIIEIGTNNIRKFCERSKNLQIEIDSISEIQQQADSLAKAELDNSINIHNEAETRRSNDNELRNEFEALVHENTNNQEQINAITDSLAEASLENAINISNEAEKRRSLSSKIEDTQEKVNAIIEIGSDKIKKFCERSQNLQNEIDSLAADVTNLAHQADSLAETGLNNAFNISNEAEIRRKGFQENAAQIASIQEINQEQQEKINSFDNSIARLTENDSRLQAQSDSLAQTGLNNALNICNEAEQRRKADSELRNEIEALAHENANNQEQINAIIEIGTSDIRKFYERSKNLQIEIDSLADNESHSREQDNSLAEASIRSNLILHEALEQRRKMLAQEIFNRVEQGNKLQSQINLLCEICLQIMINHSFIREKYVIAQDSEVNDMLNQTYNS